MLQITSIKNGFMLDHIKAGIGVKIFRYLHLDKLGHQVALIINADSKKMGKKDNNGVIFSEDGYLIQRPEQINKKELDTNNLKLSLTFCN